MHGRIDELVSTHSEAGCQMKICKVSESASRLPRHSSSRGAVLSFATSHFASWSELKVRLTTSQPPVSPPTNVARVDRIGVSIKVELHPLTIARQHHNGCVSRHFH